MSNLSLWKCDDGSWDIVGPDGVEYQNVPNAVLTAAPALLAALKDVMAHVQFFNPDEPNYTAGDENECAPWIAARAAIDQAEAT